MAPLTAEQLAAIKQAAADVLDPCCDFLRGLCAIDTTNPPGINYPECAAYIGDELEKLGYSTQLLSVAKDDLAALAPHDEEQNPRVNVIGRLRSPASSPQMVTVEGVTREKTLHFDGHFDIVPIGNPDTWQSPPLEGRIVEINGKKAMVARGVSDMKGGIAAGIWAIEAVKRAGLKLCGTVEHSGVVDEESTGVRNAGAGWLVEQGIVSPKTVDAVVITEPLNVENVCLGHRGALWATIRFHGVASHGATPQRGVNALVHAATFVVRAQESIAPLLAGKREERVIPAEARNASLTFSVFNSGKNTNNVPDLATVRIDRRLVPGETLDEARAQIHGCLEALQKELGGPDVCRFEYEENYSTEPVWVDEEQEVCRVWKSAVETVIGEKAGVVCSPGSDDQRFFVRGGIPQTIVYGPGNIKQVHNHDEHLTLEDLQKAIEIMAIGAAEFLGVEHATLADKVTQAQWADKYQEAQATGTKATKLELAGSYDAAFSAYLSAAQTYVFLIRHTTDAETKQRLRAVSAKLVERAERIKAARRKDVGPVQRDPLSLEEQDAVLERGSTVYSRRYPRWTSSSSSSALQSPAPPQPPLSPAQQASGCAWIRPDATIPLHAAGLQGADIAQDNVSDCSVVAALIVAAEHHARFASKLGLSSLFPQDSAGLPQTSPSGRYAARFLINGTWRKIEMDDALPDSGDGQRLHAAPRANIQLWPALIEKAYLTLMGGYDFSGSNSAHDLYIISGWIPEIIPLRSTFRSEATWTRLYDDFRFGGCVLTVGTGKTTDEQLSRVGLVPSHNYAVIDMREQDGRREVVLVNPWREMLRGTSDEWTAGLRQALDSVSGSHTLVVDWDALPAHFASLHVNWDPADFSHTDTVHLSAPAPLARPADRAVSLKHGHTLRLRLQVEPSSVESRLGVWLLLARHSTTPLEKDHYTRLTVERAVAFDSVGPSVKLDDESSMNDSLFQLYRFKPETGVSMYSLTVSHEGPSPSFACSLSAFSNAPAKFTGVLPPLPHSAQLQSAWTSTTAGGNHSCASFFSNPQFCVKLSAPPGSSSAKAELEVVGETAKDSPINLKLLLRAGQRVDGFESRDVLGGASTYNYGRDAFSLRDVSPGSYTLVVSSFQPQHLADFSLSLASSIPLEITTIPAEGAGLYTRQAKGAWVEGLDGGRGDLLRNPRFGLHLSKPTSTKIRLQTPAEPRPIAIAVFSTRPSGEPDKLVVSSGAYADSVCGVTVPLTRLEPLESGYVLVPSTYDAAVHVAFSVLLYADAPVTFAPA